MSMNTESIHDLIERVTEHVQASLQSGRVLPMRNEARSCVEHESNEVVTHAQRREEGEGFFTSQAGVGEGISDLAGIIDHTLLKPDATTEDIRRLCDEALRYGFASVCVNSANVALAADCLRGSRVMVCAVVGFPLGAMISSAKAYEAQEAVRAGAQEIDMVINIGALKSGDFVTVFRDIQSVVEAARPARVKVILETGLLTTEEKIAACVLARFARAHYVKTSTGFGYGGATLEDVALMRRVVGKDLGVKASGGIRSRKDAERMVAAGATRIGASASVAIVTGEEGEKKGY